MLTSVLPAPVVVGTVGRATLVMRTVVPAAVVVAAAVVVPLLRLPALSGTLRLPMLRVRLSLMSALLGAALRRDLRRDPGRDPGRDLGRLVALRRGLRRVSALLRLLRPSRRWRAVRPASLVGGPAVPTDVTGARIRDAGLGVAGLSVAGIGGAGIDVAGIRVARISMTRVRVAGVGQAWVTLGPALRAARGGVVAPLLGALLVGAAAARRGLLVTSLLRHPGPWHGGHGRPGGRGGSRLFSRVLVAHGFALLAPLRHQSCTGARPAPTR